MINNMCEFFQKIEENPDAIVTGLTIRDCLLLRAHLETCDICFNRSQRVLAKEPPDSEPPIRISFN